MAITHIHQGPAYHQAEHLEKIHGHSSECPCVSIDIPDLSDPLCDCMMTPRSYDEGTLRCVVRRNPDNSNDVEMFVEEGNVFLLSARKSGRDWLIAAQPRAQERTALVRLRSHKGNTYTCVRQRAVAASSSSSSAHENLHVAHVAQQLATGLPELNAMRVVLPGRADGAPLTASQLDCRPGELASYLQEQHFADSQCPRHDVHLLQSKKPKWNARTDSYELPFHGRASLASERNFQLLVDGDHVAHPTGFDPQRVVLLHGQLEEDAFALDFAYPLSPLHAFAISLSSYQW